MRNKLDPKIELNNNVYFKSSKNFFKHRYILPKIEIQNPKYNKNLDTNINNKNDNILIKEQKKELKEITKKEKIKTENTIKMKEKEEQGKNKDKDKKEQKIEGINRKLPKIINKKEEKGKYNFYNMFI